MCTTNQEPDTRPIETQILEAVTKVKDCLVLGAAAEAELVKARASVNATNGDTVKHQNALYDLLYKAGLVQYQRR